MISTLSAADWAMCDSTSDALEPLHIHYTHYSWIVAGSSVSEGASRLALTANLPPVPSGASIGSYAIYFIDNKILESLLTVNSRAAACERPQSFRHSVYSGAQSCLPGSSLAIHRSVAGCIPDISRPLRSFSARNSKPAQSHPDGPQPMDEYRFAVIDWSQSF